MKNDKLRTRIAPTPSGYLHLGNIYAFILTWLLTRKQDGTLLLRIDDIDASRKRPEYVQDIFYTLDWLGITYDEGPSGPEDFERNYSQHLRVESYHQALYWLKDEGNLFACTCSRKNIRHRSSDGQYPGTCRSLGRAFDKAQTAWRIFTPAGQTIQWEDHWGETISVDLYKQMRDFVVRTKARLPAYQIASLVDDKLMHVNCVVRGADLIPSTGAQLYMAKLLNYSAFLSTQFYHHKILRDTNGIKLSKSSGINASRPLREQYPSPLSIYQNCSRWLQLPEAASNLDELQTLYEAVFLTR